MPLRPPIVSVMGHVDAGPFIPSPLLVGFQGTVLSLAPPPPPWNSPAPMKASSGLSKQRRASPSRTFPRPPATAVRTGKTTLLDALRGSDMAQHEAGGITQRVAAFQVVSSVHPSGFMTVIDTPGHAAFSSMRANGVTATDVIILVIAAEAGVRKTATWSPSLLVLRCCHCAFSPSADEEAEKTPSPRLARA